MEMGQDAGMVRKDFEEQQVRIALLTPYTGGNLGDGVIQDSMIANLRLRIPGVQFTGITLSCENFIKKHGTFAFPMLASSPSPYKPDNGSGPREAGCPSVELEHPLRNGSANPAKRALRSVPGLVLLVKAARAWAAGISRELTHSFRAFRVLRKHNL